MTRLFQSAGRSGPDPGSPGLRSRAVTETIHLLASKQHGVVSRQQLIETGLAPAMIDQRVASLRLTPLFRGVYGLGPGVVGKRGLWLAATLAAGTGVVLSRRSAAALWGMLPDTHFIEVTGPFMRSTRVDHYRDRRLLVHQSRSLPPDDVTRIDSIPVTSVTRTLIDMAAGESDQVLAEAFNAADRLGLVDLDELRQMTVRARGRRGIHRIRNLLQHRHPENSATRSELESMFLELCSKNDIPAPQVNVKVCGFEVDCFWPAIKFIVELDGFSYHSRPRDFERDHDRTSDLQGFGFHVLRLSYEKVVHRPDRCLKELVRNMARAKQIVADSN